MTFAELLDEYGASYQVGGEGHRHVMPGYVGVDCFRCSPGEGKFKAGYSLSAGCLTCWTCGRLPLVEALHHLTGERYGKLRELLDQIPRLDGLVREAAGRLEVPYGLGPLGQPHLDYLMADPPWGRGLSEAQADSLVRLWGVRGLGQCGRLSWRLWLPLHHRGEVVSWSTRGLGDREPRYVNATPEQEKYRAHQLLLGGDMVRGACVVTEGWFDAYAVGPGAVATMTTSFSRAQVRRLSRVPVRAVWYDAEGPAQERARELVRQLMVFPGETYLVRSDAKDPGAAPPDEVAEVRRRFLDA